MSGMQGPGKLPPAVTASVSGSLPSGRILGSGSAAAHIRAYPWQQTPLGAIEDWPDHLVAIVNLILPSPLPLAIYWGPEMHYIGNDASIRLCRSRAGAIGLPAPQLWAENWPLIQDEFTHVLASGSVSYKEGACFSVPRDDSEREIFVDLALSPIYHQDNVVGIFRTLRETTESINSMRALAENSERLHMALSAGNGFGVWDSDLHKGITFGDEIIASIFGLDPQDAAAGVPREAIYRRLHPDDIVIMEDAVLDCIRTGVPYTVSFRTRRDDGSWMMVRTMGRCIYDAAGHAQRITGLTTVLEEKQPEAKASLATWEHFSQKAEWDLLPLHVRSFVAATLYFVADEPEKISVQVIAGPDSTQIVVAASPDDLGKFIGKQGRTIRSVRTLLLAVNKSSAHRYSIEIEDSRRRPA